LNGAALGAGCADLGFGASTAFISASVDFELGIKPVMTPTPTALNMITETAAITTIGLVLLASDMSPSLS
jgi:hypothetical protein